MFQAEKKQSGRQLPIILLILLLVLVVAGFFYYRGSSETDSPLQKVSDEQQNEKNRVLEDGTLKAEVKMPALEYENLDKDESLQSIMTSRKDDLGLKKSLDMVVHPDETITIDGVAVSVNDILEKSFAKKGIVFEKEIKEGNRSGTNAPGEVKAYGIYVVRQNDNIWDIHFNILREYYESKGIIVSSKADQPTKKGSSTGIGKILKFSEKMVVVYNISDKTLDTDINLIRPKSKVIVYNMKEIFALLNDIDFKTIDRLQFDGQSLWIPTEGN